MQIRKFEGPTMRAAVDAVKRELGPDAMIVASRRVEGGLLTPASVELSVAVDSKATTTSIGRRTLATFGVAASAYGHWQREPSTPEDELASLLEAADVEPEIARALVFAARLDDSEPAVVVARRIAACGTQERYDRGVVAVVGPTGVGKTTTVAKLAARAALIDAARVGLVTLDTYRVGAIEQLATYADLIGVPLRVARDSSQLGRALAELESADLVLIDTPGRSPHDRDPIAALSATLSSGDIRSLLAVGAPTRRMEIRSILERFRPLAPSAAIITKLDEAAALGAIANVSLGGQLPLAYVTFGQRVPEDAGRADAAVLASAMIDAARALIELAPKTAPLLPVAPTRHLNQESSLWT